MKTGVLGGTFDPVHLGHIKISKKIMTRVNLDKIIFIPSFVSPHKQYADTASAKDRLNMLKLAIKDEKCFEIDDYEIKKQKISYSIETIRYLRKKYYDDEFYWIIGADMLFYIEKWHQYDRVLRETAFICVGREGYEYKDIMEYISKLEDEYGAKIIFCKFENIDISSTEVRNRIKNARSTNGLLHTDTAKYIAENDLYIK